MDSVTLADHIFFVLISIVFPAFAVFKVRPQVDMIPQKTEVKIKLYWLNSGVLCIGGLAVIILWWLADRPWGDLGWRSVSSDFSPEWIYVTAFFVLLYMFDTFLSWNEGEEHPAGALLPNNWKEFAHFGSIVSLSAGFCEEIVFRGFLITYILAVIPSPTIGLPAALIGSTLIFAILHAYQGWVAILKIGLLTFLFGVIFVMTKSLWPVIIIHFLVDFIGGLLAVLSTKRQ